jgi:hypothetical protein
MGTLHTPIESKGRFPDQGKSKWHSLGRTDPAHIPPGNSIIYEKCQKKLAGLNDTMTKKGYNAVLDKHDNKHPYYIQLLEIRGTMLGRVLKLLDQINSENQAAAMAVDACQKNPESCR